MGVRINPCFRCPLRVGCEQIADFKRRASLTSAVSITFRCSKLGAEMRRGRRIVITAPVVVDISQYGEAEMQSREVRATITSSSPDYRFCSVVDPGEIPEGEVKEGVDVNAIRFRRVLRHIRIVRFLDEPDGTFCSSGYLLRGGTCDRKDGDCACKLLADACGSEEWRAA